MKRHKRTSVPATIVDVAALAGVSIKTVSRVVNREPNVREETRARVEAAVRSLDFHPSPSARNLAGRRSALVGLFYDNPSPSYLLSVQSAALERCQEDGYRLLFQSCDYRNPQLGRDILSLVQQLDLEGVILTPPVSGLQAVKRQLRASGIPLVCLAPPEAEPGGLCVLIDDVVAARELTEHVIELGHRRIGFILGHPDHDVTGRRHEGFKQALRRARIELDPGRVVGGQFTFESGKAAALKLLGAATRPTAIIASNDDMAAGVLAVAHALGLRTPQDLSVCGFDDTPIASIVWPALTTMRQPIYDMACSATDLLLRSIRGEVPRAPVRHSFELVRRKSTAPPGAAAGGARKTARRARSA